MSEIKNGKKSIILPSWKVFKQRGKNPTIFVFEPLILFFLFQEKKKTELYFLKNLCIKFRVSEYACLIEILPEVLKTKANKFPLKPKV